MPFRRDDDELALAVLNLCDAFEDGATDAQARIDAVARPGQAINR